jgi:hypothetical protein
MHVAQGSCQVLVRILKGILSLSLFFFLSFFTFTPTQAGYMYLY